MHLKTDMELIEGIKKGEKAAADEIVDRYYTTILFMCTKYLHSTVDGEDAAQEVFFKVLAEKKILKFRGQSKLLTWLIRVAINVCKSQFRRKSVKMTHLIDQEGIHIMEETLPCFRKSPEEEMIRADIHAKIHEGIETLPKKCRRAMQSIYLRDHSYKEAAGELNIPVNILGVRLMYGRKLMLQFFRREVRKDRSFALVGLYAKCEAVLN